MPKHFMIVGMLNSSCDKNILYENLPSRLYSGDSLWPGEDKWNAHSKDREEPPVAQVQIAGQLVVMSSNTNHPLNTPTKPDDALFSLFTLVPLS